MKTILRGRGWPAALAASLAACSQMPAATPIDLAAPTAYKETDAAWKPAQPAEVDARGEWWKVFGDAELNRLESQALLANQDLQVAAARVEEARGWLQAAEGEAGPRLDAGFGATRQKESPDSQRLPAGSQGPTQTLWRAGLSASYEVDLFGRVEAQRTSAQADERRSEALLRSVQLALQADVAQTYFHCRAQGEEWRKVSQAEQLREQAWRLAQKRRAAGEVSELDEARARTELSLARQERLALEAARAADEHKLAVLVGQSPESFALQAPSARPAAPEIPAGLPSDLLERRPDIAAAEQAMAAANARVGVARAAFFPSLSLTGAGGFESGGLGELMKWSSRTFVLGPLAGTALTLPLLDGGGRRGELTAAQAQYREQAAHYRQQVLNAFREVEDGLADVRSATRQLAEQDAAMAAARRAASLSRRQYQEGLVSYLEVIEAERTALEAERMQARLEGGRSEALVGLIRALGGGWGKPGTLPAPDHA